MSILYLHQNTFELLPSKAIFWHDRQTLLLADLHLGKAAHFRKYGVPLTYKSGLTDLGMLASLLTYHAPKRLLILGDLFHSHYNLDWEHFGELLLHFPHVEVVLVQGNHDILHRRHYQKHNIICHAELLVEEAFIFTHQPILAQEGFINFSGHIHPGFQISGLGKQSVKLPCFYLRNRTLLLPAFGKLTGLCLMPREADAEVYLVTDKSVQKF